VRLVGGGMKRSLGVRRALGQRLHGELAQRAEHQEGVFLQDVGEAGGAVRPLQRLGILRPEETRRLTSVTLTRHKVTRTTKEPDILLALRFSRVGLLELDGGFPDVPRGPED